MSQLTLSTIPGFFDISDSVLAGGQPLTAELTATSADELGLAPGDAVVATWKGTATRLVPLE